MKIGSYRKLKILKLSIISPREIYRKAHEGKDKTRAFRNGIKLNM